MDVDARERRPDGGGRGSHEAGRPVMKLPPGLYRIEEPEAPAPSNVVAIGGIRSYPHGLVMPHAVGAPWPRQVDWDGLSQRLRR
jgi:hypothetical protein